MCGTIEVELRVMDGACRGGVGRGLESSDFGWELEWGWRGRLSLLHERVVDFVVGNVGFGTEGMVPVVTRGEVAGGDVGVPIEGDGAAKFSLLPK